MVSIINTMPTRTIKYNLSIQKVIPPRKNNPLQIMVENSYVSIYEATNKSKGHRYSIGDKVKMMLVNNIVTSVSVTSTF